MFHTYIRVYRKKKEDTTYGKRICKGLPDPLSQ